MREENCVFIISTFFKLLFILSSAISILFLYCYETSWRVTLILKIKLVCILLGKENLHNKVGTEKTCMIMGDITL